MSIIDQYRCLVEAYYGIIEMDEYDLKIYVLKEIEERIRNFVNEYKNSNFDYKIEAEYIKDNISVITKLQSSLIILNKMDTPMELILLIKEKIKRLKEEK
ncbi:MAG: hypothetical protein J6J17_00625 [Bacilli bacterium]|nr:hypothetical protein [Bacilli bacterium]